MRRLSKDASMSMKILYDHQIFSLQKYGGISRYFYELMREFQTMEKIHVETSAWISNNHYIANQKLFSHWNFLPTKDFRGKRRLMSISNKFVSILKFKKQNFDIFHPTYYDPYFLDYLSNKPFVLTVFDMIHEKFGDNFSARDQTSKQKKLLIEKATKIIAISKNTKKDLIEIYGIEESKIEVIYLGNSIFPSQNSVIDMRLLHKYILFVGSRNGYKNFERFIGAVTSLLKQDKELLVICAGGGRFSPTEIESFKKLGIGKQVKQYNVDDDTLVYFYQHALMFVFPSLYEGFGIPVLESFACNCPLVCSNTSSLPEIAGSGACYFDPYSEESMKMAMIKAFTDRVFAEQLTINGKQRLQEFSWEKTARETKKVYESVLL